MQRRQEPDGEVDEEVAFWRGFITCWARKHEGSVPPRAWEALRLADRKAMDPERQSEDWNLGER